MSSTLEISDLFKKIDTKRTELQAYNKMLSIVEECTNNSDCFEPDVSKKINYIVYSNELAPSLKINPEGSDENLLGLSFKRVELTQDEQQNLKRLVHMKLLTGALDNEVKCLKPTTKDFDFSKLSTSDKNLLDLKVKLNEAQEKYYDNLQTYHKLFERMLPLKLDRSETLVNDKIELSQLTARTLQLKMDILHQKTAISVFTELPIAKQAYQMAFDDISKQQAKYRWEIEEMKALKEKYKLVGGKQFDEILNSYRSYKSAIEKKKEILEKIK